PPSWSRHKSFSTLLGSLSTTYWRAQHYGHRSFSLSTQEPCVTIQKSSTPATTCATQCAIGAPGIKKRTSVVQQT
ncbi:hypothetical protein CB0940_08589, partial [Cercospora beticola]